MAKNGKFYYLNKNLLLPQLNGHSPIAECLLLGRYSKLALKSMLLITLLLLEGKVKNVLVTTK